LGNELPYKTFAAPETLPSARSDNNAARR